MEQKLSEIYFVFYPNGKIIEATKEEMQKATKNISPQWEDEFHELGQWFLPLLPDEMMEVQAEEGIIEIKPKEILPEGSWLRNENVSMLLSDGIFGICILQPFEDKVEKIKSQFFS